MAYIKFLSLSLCQSALNWEAINLPHLKPILEFRWEVYCCRRLDHSPFQYGGMEENGLFIISKVRLQEILEVNLGPCDIVSSVTPHALHSHHPKVGVIRPFLHFSDGEISSTVSTIFGLILEVNLDPSGFVYRIRLFIYTRLSSEFFFFFSGDFTILSYHWRGNRLWNSIGLSLSSLGSDYWKMAMRPQLSSM